MPTSDPKPKFSLRLLWLAPALLVVAGGAGLAAMMAPPPADLDLSLTQATAKGLYVGTLVPGAVPVPVGTIQTWTVAVTTADGRPVEHAALAIDGGMPRHGHGLPTDPQVTEELGAGRYRVEGIKFNMPGWWTVTLEISGPAGTDSATFNFDL
jgi:hypothetical protein